MTDMKSAGLNPMLAYSQGGASTPAGAMATIPDFGNSAQTMMKGASLKAEIDKVKQDTNTSAATAGNQKSQTDLHNAQRDLLEAQLPKERLQGDFFSTKGFDTIMKGFNDKFTDATTAFKESQALKGIDAMFQRLKPDSRFSKSKRNKKSKSNLRKR